MVRIPALLALASASLAIASPSLNAKSNENVYYHRSTDTAMSIVTNSGICETTPGVKQVSGYLTVGKNMVRNYPPSFRITYAI
jgi:hypothetical protein